MGSKGCGGIDFTPCNHHPETCTCRWKDEPIKIIKSKPIKIKKLNASKNKEIK